MEQVLLELASLPARYPDVGEDLLITYGPRVIFRLAHDPTRQAESVLSREVHVDWVARPGNAPPQSILRAVGWEGMVDIVRRCPQVALTTNPQTITEQAAIGVMALLVNDLEGATALEVLPIGSGPDYRLWSITSKAFTIEVSGIRKVDSPADARKRLTDKRRQLLGKMESGFVSVTTFSHPTGPIVHSYLHFVSRSDGRPGKKRGRTERWYLRWM